MPRPQRVITRSGKLLLGISGGFIVLLVGGAYWLQHLERDPVLPKTKSTLPVPNALDAFVEAGKQIVAYDDLMAATANFTERAAADSEETGKPLSTAQKQALYNRNRQALRLIRAGLAQEFRLPPAASTEEPYPLFKTVRAATRLFLLEGELHEQNGDYGEAMSSYAQALAIGSKVARGGAFIGMLVAHHADRLGRERLWQVYPRLSASQARAATRQLEGILSNSYPYAETLRDENAFGQMALMELLSKPGWRRSWPEPDEWDLDEDVEVTPGMKLRLWFISDRQIMANYNRYREALLKQAQIDFKKRQPIALPDDPVLQSSSVDFAEMEQQSRVNALSNEAKNRLLLAAVALHAYRLGTGRYPAALSGLRPQYLSQLPADPFNANRPLLYRLEGDRYRLYSVGPDGVDDQGKPIQKASNSDEEVLVIRSESKGDIMAGVHR